MKSVVLCFLLLAAFVQGIIANANAGGKDVIPNAVIKVRAAEHGDAVIPCGQSKIFLDGPGAFVSWLKDDRRVLYRFPINNSNTDERSFNDICYRSPDIKPCRERTSLFLPRVTKDDAGFYRCRIHYNASPVVDFDFHLTIVDPPGELKIYTKNHIKILENTVGPYAEGQNITLMCESDDYRTNIVKWVHDGQIITDPKIVKLGLRGAELNLYSLQREAHGARYACVVQPADITPPLIKEILITMYLPPLQIIINMDAKYALEVGSPKVIDCIITGFIPAPTVNWYLENTLIKSEKFKFHAAYTDSQHVVNWTPLFQDVPDHNVTLSSFTLIPELSDNNSILSCRATNKYFTKGFKNEVKLRVGLKPKCVVKSTSRIEIKPNVVEKVVCIVDSYPPPIAFTWNFPNNKIIATPVQATAIPTRFKSTLSWIPHRDEIGKLDCKATNYHGEQEEPCYFDIGPECANEKGNKVPCKPGQSNDITTEMDKHNDTQKTLVYQFPVIDEGSDIIEKNIKKLEVRGPWWVPLLFFLGSSFVVGLCGYICLRFTLARCKSTEGNGGSTESTEQDGVRTVGLISNDLTFWRGEGVMETNARAFQPITTTPYPDIFKDLDYPPETVSYCV